MANLVVDERDQQFVLNEVLNVEGLCKADRFGDFSRELFDMVLTEAQKIGLNQIFPTLVQSDREGCRLENGQVHVPECFHSVYKLFCEGGWNAMSVPPEHGGQGLPLTIRTAAHEWFDHNFSFMAYPGTAEGAAHLVEVFGTEEQHKKYMEKMITGEWGGTMVLTEPGAGTDVGNLNTKAVRQPDGTYRIQGTKMFITAGDHDLVENIVHPVLARIEGHPAGTKGISIFLVPKYLVNDDGTLGKRNDFEITKIEEKMGIHGSATCVMNFGDNGECYAELLGEEMQGMPIMFQLMNEARIGVGLQSLASASISYLHSVQYAKERLQGSSLMEMKNPEAPRVPIIQHPDVRRMLLWMKSNTESLRLMAYFCAYSFDKSEIVEDDDERDKWLGFTEILTPILKAYGSDTAFRVTELAIQVYGGYGFCSEYPVEQFMRDVKIASLYEGANGIQALDLVGRKLGLKKGAYFMNLLGEMNRKLGEIKKNPALSELADEVQAGVNTLGDAGLYFAKCGKGGDFLVPLAHAYPFLVMMGKVMSAWFLLWEADVATGKLDVLCKEQGLEESDPKGRADLIDKNSEAAFYAGKLTSAKFFVRTVLPEVESALKGIKSGDISVMEITEAGF
jgi:alkylation response protein AidB-like acyl-CoA dehydrogenase